MSPKARTQPGEEGAANESSLQDFRFIIRPPEGHPKTFTDTRTITDPDTGEDSEEEFDREYFMDMFLRAENEQAARLQVERHLFNMAVQEAGTDDPNEVLKKQWQIEGLKQPETESE